MKRIALAVLLTLVAGLAAAQTIYSQRLLETLGLAEEEIEQIVELERRTQLELRRHEADLEIRKAELARLLLDEDPNMRQVERNLRETAAVEVEIRLLEIERELAIREVVGTERWTRIVQAIRARRAADARERAGDGASSEQIRERLAALQRELAERQQALQRSVQERTDILDDDEIREQFRELQREYLELQELIRERL